MATYQIVGSYKLNQTLVDSKGQLQKFYSTWNTYFTIQDCDNKVRKSSFITAEVSKIEYLAYQQIMDVFLNVFGDYVTPSGYQLRKNDCTWQAITIFEI